jgi:uncharacterized flavoprotein (TIGR03862 family)
MTQAAASPPNARAAVIGGGPAGLTAAEALLSQGVGVDLYDAMPSLGRKLLMAGKSGLNLTNAEPFAAFAGRYDPAPPLRPMLEAFPPDAVRDWAHGLGCETFVGTSGRVFPKAMKASPLLRAWLRRLDALGLRAHLRHAWTGWDARTGALSFSSPGGDVSAKPDAAVLALGGASWPRLGSAGTWREALSGRGVAVAAFQPSNCGFEAEWSTVLRERGAGHALKGVRLRIDGHEARGDCVVTAYGLEGGPVFALSRPIRDAVARDGAATVSVDLIPDVGEADAARRLRRPRGKNSAATHLKRTLSIGGVKALVLREGADPATFADPDRLAARIKALPVTLRRARPVAEAISTAGGVAWSGVSANLELTALPGVYVCGEMLDWDAPTGGYLLSACLATGRWAGRAAAGRIAPAAAGP